MDKEETEMKVAYWKQVSNLCAEICELNESLETMMSSAFDQIERENREGKDKYGMPFLNRVKARAEAISELPEPNTVSKIEREGEPWFMIRNYDYLTFKWAIKNGFGPWIDCNVIYVQKSKLSKYLADKMESKIKS